MIIKDENDHRFALSSLRGEFLERKRESIYIYIYRERESYRERWRKRER